MPGAANGVASGSPGAPRFLAGDLPPPELTPSPPVPAENRVKTVMTLWRQSIIVRDPDSVLACDRMFTDEPAVFGPALVESANSDGEERIRAFSTRVLGKFTDPALAPVFLHLLEDASPFVRGNAAWALGQLSPDLGTAALERVRQQDRAESVRQSAAEALARLQRPRNSHPERTH